MALVRLNKEGVVYEFDPENSSDLLGRGGMGVVFKGRRIDRGTGYIDQVAIKVLFKDLPAESITRARREASIQIEHENVIRMFGFIDVVSTDSKITCHVISEYLDGETLDKKYAQGEILPTSEAIRITKSILSGLYMLHNKGYIHRDIDPSNVMICNNGRIKLIDFGIAKSLSEYHDEFKHGTQEGKFIGKVNYASPEQAQGLHWITNTTSDIYSTGILLFELLMGRLPYSGTTYEIIKSHIDSPIVFDKTMDISLQNIISKATAKQQEDRYQSVSEFIVDLEKFEKGIKIPAPSRKQDLKPAKSKSKLVPTLIVLLVIVLGVVAGGLFYLRSERLNDAKALAMDGHYKQAIDEYIEATNFFVLPSENRYIESLQKMIKMVNCYHNIQSSDTLLMQEFEKIGADGISDAYYYSAELNMKGISTPRDLDAGLASLIKGSQDDNILCNYRLGVAYLTGECVSKNDVMASRYFDKARSYIEKLDIDDLSSELLYIYGKMYLYGYSVDKSFEQAELLLRMSAEMNNPAAYYELSKLYTLRKKRTDATECFNKAVELGYTEAEYESAMAITSASAVYKKTELLNKAANKRYSPAYYQIALIHKKEFDDPKKMYKDKKTPLESYGRYIDLAVSYDISNSKYTKEQATYKSKLAAYNKQKPASSSTSTTSKNTKVTSAPRSASTLPGVILPDEGDVMMENTQANVDSTNTTTVGSGSSVSTAASASENASASASTAASSTASTSASTSASTAASTSASTSASTAASTSASTSEGTSTSKDTSASTSSGSLFKSKKSKAEISQESEVSQEPNASSSNTNVKISWD